MSNSCSIFCQSQGNHLSFTACDDLENEFALLCSCSDTPVLNALSCLQNLCSSDEFNALVASEESRCGAAAVSGITTSSTPAQTVTVIATEPTRVTVTVENPPRPTSTGPSRSGVTLSSTTTSSTTNNI
ncbi:uncharacterized protein TRAVEDRAFT_31135, partial [Trametes versicolor FP-101664 SS1]|uniref:uncharacterized protein n=1 Tax=Trametes versicolor (strain FP-101664) TaxID=717944 RepID=UPI0004622E6E